MKKIFIAVSMITSASFATTSKTTLQDLRKKILTENIHYSERWSATMKMAELEDPQAVNELQQLLNRKEWFLRNAALLGLEKLSPQKGYEAAKKLIHDSALVVRSAALDVLKPQLTDKDRSLLWTELNQKYNFRGKESLWIRKDIIEALGESAQPEEYGNFTKFLRDTDENVQLQAALALDKLSGLGLELQTTNRKDFIFMWQKQAATTTDKAKR